MDSQIIAIVSANRIADLSLHAPAYSMKQAEGEFISQNQLQSDITENRCADSGQNTKGTRFVKDHPGKTESNDAAQECASESFSEIRKQRPIQTNTQND